MGFDLISKIKKGYENYQDEQSRKKAEEEHRKSEISEGHIQPIKTDFNLEPEENAYATFSSQRMAIVSHTISTEKKKGVAGRAVVGGLLLGPLGALGGAVTAGSKTSEKSVEAIERIDAGQMIMTNKRFLFVGQNSMISVLYEKAIDILFSNGILKNSLTIKYPEMAKGEHFVISGPSAKDAELYFKGIKNINKKG